MRPKKERKIDWGGDWISDLKEIDRVTPLLDWVLAFVLGLGIGFWLFFFFPPK